MIECAKCGHRNPDGTEFCQNCGTFLGYEGKKLESLPGSVLVGIKTGAQAAPITGGSPSPSPTVTTTAPPVQVVMVPIPNVTCMTPLVAQQAIEGAGFKFSGSFVSNASYPNGTVSKTQPLSGSEATKGSEVTTFVSTGPPPGVRPLVNQCQLIIKQLPSNFFQYIHPLVTPTP